MRGWFDNLISQSELLENACREIDTTFNDLFLLLSNQDDLEALVRENKKLDLKIRKLVFEDLSLTSEKVEKKRFLERIKNVILPLFINKLEQEIRAKKELLVKRERGYNDLLKNYNLLLDFIKGAERLKILLDEITSIELRKLIEGKRFLSFLLKLKKEKARQVNIG